MRTIPVFVAIAAMACGSAAHAQRSAADKTSGVELAVSEETLQIRYDTPTSTGGAGSRMVYSVFLSEERDVVASAALLVDSDLRFGAVEITFGPQAYAALLDEENEDVFALAVGAEARLNLIPSRSIAVVGSAYYSPDVLTFGSADNLTDFMVRAEMQINDRLLGFAGYRWFELDLLDRDERTLQNELFVGVRYQLR